MNREKTVKEKMLSGELHVSMNDRQLLEERMRARSLFFRLNALPPDREEERKALIRELFGAIGENFVLESPFRCDYGSNIHAGENFYANYNCVILDCARVTIGDNVLIGPNVSIFAAGHPVHPELRQQDLEYAFPVTIGDRVWLGGGTIVNPGVTVGENSVIGSGSIITRDIPADVVAAGNPCRILREINETDRQRYFRDCFVTL